MFLTIYKAKKVREEALQLCEQYPNNIVVPKMPNSKKLSKWYSLEIEYYEKIINLAEEKNNLKCMCSKGCTYCCKQAIGVNKNNIMAMFPILDKLTFEQKEIIKNNVNIACEKLTENGFAANTHLSDDLQEKYFNLNLMCPLNINGECIAYKCRPPICWSYRCYNEPLQCSKKYNPEGSIVFSELLMDICKKIAKTKSYLEKQTTLLPFALKYWVIPNLHN